MHAVSSVPPWFIRLFGPTIGETSPLRNKYEDLPGFKTWQVSAQP